MDSVVIDVGTRDARRVLAGGVVCAIVGAVAVAEVIRAYAAGEASGVTIGVAVLGLLFLGIAFAAVAGWRVASRPRRLVFEAAGIRWEDPGGAPWAVAWHELGEVRISRTRERVVVDLSDALMRTTLVRLDLVPADPPGFRGRHAGMAHLLREENGGYRLPLGNSADLIPIIERAARRFAPQIYQGVRDEGFIIGLM